MVLGGGLVILLQKEFEISIGERPVDSPTSAWLTIEKGLRPKTRYIDSYKGAGITTCMYISVTPKHLPISAAARNQAVFSSKSVKVISFPRFVWLLPSKELSEPPY